MHAKLHIILLLLMLTLLSEAQDTIPEKNYKVSYKGQVSAWSHYNPKNTYPLNLGGRYIPQINSELAFKKQHLIDAEFSANTIANADVSFFDSAQMDGSLNAYRLWARYSNKQIEFRIGLQKIDFGTAVMLRSLRWFDQMDPRDPLKLTTGVWGGLFRYYFLNNTNVWFWALYGNENLKGTEVFKSNKRIPEYGGRIQFPIPLGESGISYHHRKADTRNFNPLIPEKSAIPENRLGIDIKIDYVLGFWFEGAWIHKKANLGNFKNQEFLTWGSDYTIGIGNGLNLTAEHMLYLNDQKAFQFNAPDHFSGFSANYPIGMFNSLSTMFYFDWGSKSAYNFVNWNVNFDHITFYVMFYWNPENKTILTGNPAVSYAGKGFQLMLVYNH